jgi:hypothetical protein
MAPTFRLGVPACASVSPLLLPLIADGCNERFTDHHVLQKGLVVMRHNDAADGTTFCARRLAGRHRRTLIHTGRGVPNARTSGLSEASLIVETAMPVDSGTQGLVAFTMSSRTPGFDSGGLKS